ncbi:MAG: pitrilysin family protein [Desulfobacterales bacterium]|nr:pitrilysin family protein [Desulfobacterales bacterium]MDD4071454.1 pitrilysin family protein [Desulfobacterales bacterium]MDD4393214.1 pitrilysin family protein [Desulfobacterales bacterium]
MAMLINKTCLDNGIRVLSCHMPSIRSVTMGVWVNVGARDETLSENGLSHLIEHMIFKGTTHRSAFQIAKEFDAIGGQTNAFTTMEHTCYHARVMDTHLRTMVDILSDIFLNSVFDNSELEKEIPVILQEISMLEELPDDYIHFLLEKDFWGNSPLGQSILGTTEKITGLTTTDIRNFFNHHYQAERIVISAAGNIDHGRFIDLIEPYFNSIPAGTFKFDRTPPPMNYRVNVYERPLEQVHACIGTNGLSLTDPRRFAFSLLNTLLGGNMSSKLFQEIREKRGLAYYVYSFISSYEDTGMFGAYVAVHPKHLLETIELIVKGMRSFKLNRITASELKDAGEYIKTGLYMASESPESQMFRLAQNEVNFGDYIPLETVIEQIESVTQDDILELADSLFSPGCQALTMLGPVHGNDSFNDLLAQV